MQDNVQMTWKERDVPRAVDCAKTLYSLSSQDLVLIQLLKGFWGATAHGISGFYFKMVFSSLPYPTDSATVIIFWSKF